MKSSKLESMKVLMKYISVVCLFLFPGCEQEKNFSVAETMEVVEKHMENMTAANTDPSQYPRTTNPDGSLATVSSDDWTSGFFPGTLWYMYEYTKDEKWEELARKWT